MTKNERIQTILQESVSEIVRTAYPYRLQDRKLNATDKMALSFGSLYMEEALGAGYKPALAHAAFVCAYSTPLRRRISKRYEEPGGKSKWQEFPSKQDFLDFAHSVDFWNAMLQSYHEYHD